MNTYNHGLKYQEKLSIFHGAIEYWKYLGVSKKPAAHGPLQARPVALARWPALRPAFNFFLKNNILYFYIYIINSFKKHKKNVAQLVRALKFKLERRGSNPPLFLPLFKSHFGLFKKARGPARWPGSPSPPPSPRAHRPGRGPSILARPGPPVGDPQKYLK